MSSFISISHTAAAVDTIKKDLNLILRVTGIIIAIVLMIYDIAKVVLNLDSLIKFLPYVFLFIITLTFFIGDFLVKENKDLPLKVRKEKKERYAIGKRITNIFKYILKFTTFGYSLFEIFAYDNTGDFEVITTLALGVLIVAQLILQIVIDVIYKYCDYLKIAIQLDVSNSPLIKTFAEGQNLTNDPREDFTKREEKIALELDRKVQEKESKKLGVKLENPFINGTKKIVSLLFNKKKK